MEELIKQYQEDMKQASREYDAKIKSVFKKSYQDFKEAIPAVKDVLAIFSTNPNDEGGTSTSLRRIEVYLNMIPDVEKAIIEKNLTETYDIEDSTIGIKYDEDSYYDDDLVLPLSDIETQCLKNYYQFLLWNTSYMSDFIGYSEEKLLSEF